MLVEHRVDDVDERLVAVEQPVATGEEVALEPALALVLAEHRVEDASRRREELVVRLRARVPLTVGHFEDGAQEIREGLVGTEDPEVPLLRVQGDDVAEEPAQHEGVLGVDRARRRHRHGMLAEVRHAQLAQQDAAVGVGIGAHAPVALGRQLGQARRGVGRRRRRVPRACSSASSARAGRGDRDARHRPRAAPDGSGTCLRSADRRRPSGRSNLSAISRRSSASAAE